MDKGDQPKGLPALLRWYAKAWEAEIPDKLHASGIWRDHGTQAEGGSALGSLPWSDPFRRYLENSPSEIDEDGYFRRPIHAALSRLSRPWPMMSRTLFAIAQAGFLWRDVATRGHWAVEMFEIYTEEALRRLWREYAERVD